MVNRSRRLRLFWALGATIALAGPPITTSNAVAGTPASACGDSWSIAPIVPTPGGWGVQATAASSASDAWIVSTGFSDVGFNFPTPQHWDGTTWTVTPLPDTGVQWLFGVASLGPTDAWAVGYAYTGYAYRYRVMITHWNGSSWSDVPSPGRLGAYSELRDIDAVSPSDIWAVGDSRQEALIEHWDGTSWSLVPSTTTASDAVSTRLDAVSFAAPDEGWAVGASTTQHGYSSHSHPLLMHWDGSRWAREPRPARVDVLSDVVAIASDDAWAVGAAAKRAVVVHWDGVSWSIVPSPSPGSSATLAAVSSLGTDAWAVGHQRAHPGMPLRTIIERWDGSSWDVEPSPNVGGKNNLLVDVSAVPGLLLAGGYSGGGAAPLALERCPP
jgi:hypothetical protein